MPESFFSEEELFQLKKITELYPIAKELLLYSEELNNLETFMPPINELRDALDHFMRICAVKFGLKKSDEKDYTDINLDKVHSHIYRATFELFDYIRIYQHDAIANKLGNFSNEALVTVFPDYYRVIRPEVEDLINQIPLYKKEKDIGAPDLGAVKKYYDAIQKIRGHIDTINRMNSVLVEFEVRKQIELEAEKKRQDAEKKRDDRRMFLYMTISAIVSGVICGIAAHFFWP